MRCGSGIASRRGSQCGDRLRQALIDQLIFGETVSELRCTLTHALWVIATEQDEGDGDLAFAQRTKQLKPIESGHVQIRDDAIKAPLALEQCQRIAAIAKTVALVAGIPENGGHDGAEEWIIVHDQNIHSASLHFRQTCEVGRRETGKMSLMNKHDSTPSFKLPRAYKTFLMVALVFLPFFWLAFTEDGQRRTDLALMALLGKPDFNAALEDFDRTLTETRLRETFPKLELHCADGANPFGNRLCAAEIGAFNHYPASAVTLFFVGEQLRAAKVVYRRAYHPLIHGWVTHRLAQRELPPIPAADAQSDPGVRTEPVRDGLLLLPAGELGEDDEPALIWLSGAALAARS